MSSVGIARKEPRPLWHQTALTDVCKAVGLDPTGAQLIKFTNNAVFALASEPVVVRISGSPSVGDRVSKVIAVARWLAEHDMPSVRLLEQIPQPVTLGGHAVTFWHRVPPSDATPNGTDLGQILRRYHALPPPTCDLPRWQPVAEIRRRIADEDVLSLQDHTFLERRCDEIEAALNEMHYFLEPGPIHGDSFIGNLIPGTHGPVICDFDSAALGPREWDLTPVAVGKLRFSYAVDSHRQVAEAYGTDILKWSDFGALRQLRELQLVTSVLPVLRSNPTLVDQWRHRFRTFRHGDDDATWIPYR